MGLRWSSREVCACAVALVLGGSLASACGGQAFSDGPEPFGGSSGSASTGARGGAAGAGGGRPGTGATGGRGGAGSTGVAGISGVAGNSGVAGGSSGNAGSSGVAAGGSAAIDMPRSMGRPCNSPVAISGGWVQCADGLLQRSEPAACTSRLPRPAPDLTGVPQELINSLECTKDTDCAARPHGACVFEIPVRELPRCEYGCVTDGDCPGGFACVCGADIGRCAAANCFRGTDCPVGFACLVADTECADEAVACETFYDECRSASDCPSGTACFWNGERRICSAGSSCLL